MGHRIVLALLAAASLGVGCKTPEPPGEKVVVGVSLLRISQPVFVALDRGLFARRGLDVEVKRFDTAQPLADELAAGRIDAGGYVAFPILFDRPAPPKVRVVTAIVEDAQHPISYLLVKKGSGLKGVAALKGKKVGVLPTAAYKRWFAQLAAAAGLAPDEVTVTPIAPPMEVDALENGGVDALFTGDPMATAALARGVAEPLTDTPEVPRVLGSPFVFGTFALSDAWATEHPGTARKVTEALDEAIGLLAADPALGPKVLATVVREPEKAFVARYPPSSYLTSKELKPDALAKALTLSNATVTAAEVSPP